MSTPTSDDTREIWSLPVPSQEFRDGPRTELERDSVRLHYDYETQTGEYAWAELTFSGVEALAFTSHESCSEQQVDAYDVLVEVTDSSWIGGIQQPRVSAAEGLRHMRIYFDEVGCYEVVAASFDAPTMPPP